MKFDINPDTVLNAMQAKCIADSVLIGASMLNSANALFTNRLPNDAALPCGLFTTFGFAMDDTGSEYSGEVRLFVYSALSTNGQISALGNSILARCEEILANETLTITNMTVQPIRSLGIIPTMFDAETDKFKARGVLRLRVTCGYNGL
jgi:hypothetical protein